MTPEHVVQALAGLVVIGLVVLLVGLRRASRKRRRRGLAYAYSPSALSSGFSFSGFSGFGDD